MKKLPAKVVMALLKKDGIILEKREFEQFVKELAQMENPMKVLLDHIERHKIKQ